MNKHRLSAIISFGILVGSFAGMGIFWLNKNCPALSSGDCQLLWGSSIAAILGGYLFAETLLVRQKAQGKWRAQTQDSDGNQPILSGSQVWFISITRVILASLLVGLPLFIQGTLAVTITSTLAGAFLAGLIRAILNRLPPVEGR